MLTPKEFEQERDQKLFAATYEDLNRSFLRAEAAAEGKMFSTPVRLYSTEWADMTFMESIREHGFTKFLGRLTSKAALGIYRRQFDFRDEKAVAWQLEPAEGVTIQHHKETKVINLDLAESRSFGADGNSILKAHITPYDFRYERPNELSDEGYPKGGSKNTDTLFSPLDIPVGLILPETEALSDRIRSFTTIVGLAVAHARLGLQGANESYSVYREEILKGEGFAVLIA